MARVLTSDSLLFPAYHAASQNMHVELRHTSKKIMVGGNQKALDTMSLGPCGSRLNCSDRANTEGAVPAVIGTSEWGQEAVSTLNFYLPSPSHFKLIYVIITITGR